MEINMLQYVTVHWLSCMFLIHWKNRFIRVICFRNQSTLHWLCCFWFTERTDS